MGDSEKYLIEQYNYKESRDKGKKVLAVCILFFLLLMIFIIINRQTYWWIPIYIVVGVFVIELIVYISTNLNYYDMKNKNLIYGTIMDSDELSKYMNVPMGDEYKNKVQLGYDIAKTRTLLILCLARDVEYNMEMTRNKLESIGRDFLDYQIIFFENDSDDETRKLLKNWMSVDKHVDLMNCCDEGSCDCLLNNEKGYDMGPISQGRIGKMRHYREKMLRYATENYNEYDYVMIYDFDISGIVYKDGLMTSFSSEKDWDMVFASGYHTFPKIISRKPSLYDGFAYISKDNDYDHKLSVSQLDKQQNKLRQYKIGDDLVKCKSGFNGIAIYRMECLLESSYMNNTERYCEHIDLHEDMYNKGYREMYYNPSMVLFVGQSGPDRTSVFDLKQIRNYTRKANN